MNSPKSTSEVGPAPTQKPIEYKRSEDFIESYANNVQLQPSGWDLKLIFGELDQSISESTVVQHTAVTLTWRQVKVLIYFLQLHLIGQEAENGRVLVPKRVISELPSQPPKELAEKFPLLEKSWKVARKLYEDFIAANPEAKP